MSNINDGGPAYPSMRDMRHNPDFDHEPGMSLRDYFAAMAMQGILSGNPPITRERDCEMHVAIAAYAMADAMLKAKGQS